MTEDNPTSSSSTPVTAQPATQAPAQPATTPPQVAAQPDAQINFAQSQTPVYTQASPTAGMKGSSPMKQNNVVFGVLCGVVLLAGIGTGAGIHGLRAKSQNGPSTFQGQAIKEQPTGEIKVGEIIGNPSEDGFPDHIKEGVLQAGGFEGEGTHHLLREGGPSQTVYLRSSVTDLDKFVGMKIEIWGQTDKPQKVGWLMDVGRIKVLELNAQTPAQEEE